VNKTEFYNQLSTCLDHNSFEFDDTKKVVNVDVPLNPQNIKDLKKFVLCLLSDRLLPYEFEWNLSHYPEHFRIDNHFIRTDGETIDKDPLGQLCIPSG